MSSLAMWKLITITSASAAARRTRIPRINAVAADSSASGTTRANTGAPGSAIVSRYHRASGRTVPCHC